MGLLMSDTTLIDPMLDETMRLRDGLSEWVYGLNAARDSYEHEAVDSTDDPTSWPLLLIWSQDQIAHV